MFNTIENRSMSLGYGSYNDGESLSSLHSSDSQCLSEINGTAVLSVEESAEYGLRQGQFYLITIVLPFIVVLGVVLNSAFLYVIFRVKQMRTITNRYLANLAVADILFLISAIGPKLLQYATSPFEQDDSHLGPFGCVSVYFLIDTSYFSSLCFITLTSLDRFVALCRPLDRNSIVARQSKKLIAGSWILSGALAASLTPANGNFEYYCKHWANVSPFNKWPKTLRYCMPIRRWITPFSLGVQTLPFFTTSIYNAYLFVSIIRELNRSMAFRYGKDQQLSISSKQKSRDFRARNQVAKMLMFNGMIFFVCLCPYELMSLCTMIASLRQGSYLIPYYPRYCIFTIARVLSYLNSAINPLIYTAMCTPYKAAFREAFCGRRPRKPPLVTRTSTIQETEIIGM